MTSALAAFQAVDFNWTRALRDVWTDPAYHVEEINKPIVDAVIAEFKATTKRPDSNPIGQVIQGRAGAGKTHLIGTLRRRVWETGGWFVLIDIVAVTDFWQTAALSFVESLHQPMPNGRLQYQAAVDLVLQTLFHDANARKAIVGPPKEPLTRRTATDLYLAMLKRLDPVNAPRHQDVVRALIFLDAKEVAESNFAYMWLQGQNVDDEIRRDLKFLASNPRPVDIVRGLLWILSLAGPTMIAIDQIDAVVSASNRAEEAAGTDDVEARRASALIEALALGLIDLHDVKRRAMTVVSCLEVTWPILTARAIAPFSGRFRAQSVLAPVTQAAAVAELVGERLAKAYAATKFTPPYPTWPFTPKAIESAVGLRPREILTRCDEHRRACLAAGRVTECASLAEARAPAPTAAASPSRLDPLFAQEWRNADPGVFGKDEAADARSLVQLCEIYLGHLDLPDEVDGEVRPDADRRSPSLHATLAFVFHDQGDRQQRWCFRWLPQDNAIAFQSRLKAAMTASGIDTALKSRHLVILRDSAPPKGPKTQELVEQFLRAGGQFVTPSDEDRRVWLALIALADRNLPEFETWLRARRPLFETSLFKAAGLAPPAFLGSPATPPSPAAAKRPEPAPPPQTVSPRAISIGRRVERGSPGGAPVTLDAGLLPRHVAILAGTGSGKTVLLRRIVEEAALLGVPSVVLDVNNDLSRLGETWPSPPEGFTDVDIVKARAYRERAEVVIWTPGLSSGNPLSLRLLPDFSAIGTGSDAETRDERAQAVEMALATLDPLIGGSGRKAVLNRGVLADALRAFALAGGGSLDDLIARLAEFDPEDSRISDAARLAGEMADQLNAVIAANPLMRASGPSLDPARLFAGSAGKTRISVINLGALASDAAKQAFVNQLQMALFTWIKQHPSPTGRLYALDEAQNFAPSQIGAACKRSALALVSQARKYGLGMIFATQQPKGVDNAIISNCTTHVYGRMSSPTAIEAVKEMVAAKGGSADDIARLSRGEFYFSTEGSPRPVKIQAPLCLSWHPANPPTAEEVAALARKHRP
jgi:hypothetical protein